MKKFVIVRISGGLGNQLFTYSAAKRLAVKNNAELIIDNITGFKYDTLYKRVYQLDNFLIEDRKLDFDSRFEIIFRIFRILLKVYSRFRSFDKRIYVSQKENDFDERLLSFPVKKIVFLEGGWQSEDYFRDIRDIILRDLRFKIHLDNDNLFIRDRIINSTAIAVHLRFFDNIDLGDSYSAVNNLNLEYYIKSINYIKAVVEKPHFFIFSDKPDKAKVLIQRVNFEYTVVDTNNGKIDSSILDLYLMTICNHFIIANSTFSWWGAWLCQNTSKIVICPKLFLKNSGKIITSWGFKGLLPDSWIKM